MNKAELVAKIAEKVGMTKKVAEDAVETLTDIVTETLKAGGEVTIAGFGTFSAKQRAGRTGVNPQNPSEKIQIPPVVVPKFKAGKSLKDSLKGKR
ncbi:HU family DNA-binding protein [Candidatus Uhrbacteria bacterium]|nr:HU family DNA-binding protein [Candidatus Uhrbacteria bacterium]